MTKNSKKYSIELKTEQYLDIGVTSLTCGDNHLRFTERTYSFLLKSELKEINFDYLIFTQQTDSILLLQTNVYQNLS